MRRALLTAAPLAAVLQVSTIVIAFSIVPVLA